MTRYLKVLSILMLWPASTLSLAAQDYISLQSRMSLESFREIVEITFPEASPLQQEVTKLTFTLHNPSDHLYDWIIDFKKNDYVGVSVFVGDSLIARDTVGYLVPGSLKKLGRGNISNFFIPPGTSRKFEITLRKESHLIDTHLEIMSQYLWLSDVRTRLAIDIGFVAILLVFGIYNLTFFIQSHRRSHFFFGGYLLIVALFFAFVSMLLRDYIFCEHPRVTLYFMVLALVAPLFHWRFVQSLVATSTLIPRLDRLMNFLVVTCLVVAGVQVLLFAAGQSYKLISHITKVGLLINIGFTMIAYTALLLKRDRITSYFLYGTLFMLIGVAYDAWNWDLKDDLSDMSKVGFVVEIAFFSLGLGKRIQLDSEESQHQLELLVDKRTADLNQQRNFFASILNDVNSLVFVRDADSNMIFCNAQYADIYNKKPEDLIGKNLSEIAGDQAEFYRKIKAEDERLMAGEVDKALVLEEASLKDEDVWMRVSKKKVLIDGVPFLLGVLFDISTLKKTEQKLQKVNRTLKRKIADLQSAEWQLIEFEKMASIGQLTSGLAHEIGNPVNFLAGNVQPLVADLREMEQLVEMVEHNRGYLDKSQKGKEMLKFFDEVDFHYTIREVMQLMEGIEHGSARVKSLVESFRDFSRANSAVMVPSDLNKAMTSTIRLIEHTIRGRIALSINLDPDLPMVSCSMGQVSQVFLNLINNAIQAIPEEGVITISSRCDDISVFFDIEDTGLGVRPSNLKKIFEPFFTTKEVGKGTGLGLAMSKNIIAKHNGEISVASKVGLGSKFTVRLPQ